MASNTTLSDYYQGLTNDLVHKWESTESKYNRTMIRRIQELTLVDHIKLLKEIITGHTGGKRIKIYYGVPIHAETCNGLKEYFESQSWFVLIEKDKPGITLSNYDVHKEIISGENCYNAYSYRRYRDVSGVSTYDFYICDLDLAYYLILFSRHIRVMVSDLQIPVNQICSPGGKFRQAPPMAYNETFG